MYYITLLLEKLWAETLVCRCFIVDYQYFLIWRRRRVVPKTIPKRLSVMWSAEFAWAYEEGWPAASLAASSSHLRYAVNVLVIAKFSMEHKWRWILDAHFCPGVDLNPKHFVYTPVCWPLDYRVPLKHMHPNVSAIDIVTMSYVGFPVAFIRLSSLKC